MSVKSFKFVSPGVFIHEIDNSGVPNAVENIGPLVIGRSTRGLAMQPVKVNSNSEFIDMFGNTVPGGANDDVYRKGNYTSPMYGTYAANAFLKSGVAPLTYIRLLGQQTTKGSSAGGDAAAGWKTANNPGPLTGDTGGAYGLFVCASGSTAHLYGDSGVTTSGDASAGNPLHLAAVFYMNSGSLQLRGSARRNGVASGDSAQTGSAVNDKINAASVVIGMDSDGLFNLVVTGAVKGNRIIKFNFDDSNDKFIRNRVNTNPQLLSTAASFFPSSTTEDIWLGETFEQELRDLGIDTTTNLQGVILGLSKSGSLSTGPHNMKKQASREGVAGWFIGQDIGGDPSKYDAKNQQKLFRLVGRGHGEWLHKNVKVSIEKIRASNSTLTDYGTFSVVLRHINDTDNSVQVLERFDSCTLDPTNPNYIARKIGDKYASWSTSEKRLKEYGEYPNLSKYVYVEINSEVDSAATDPTYLPFGYFGPPGLQPALSASTTTNLSTNSIFLQGSASMRASSIDYDLMAFDGKGPANKLKVDFFVGVRQTVHLACPPGDRIVYLAAATASIHFPIDRLRISASHGGLPDTRDAYWGWSTTRKTSNTIPDVSVVDWHRLLYSDFPNDPTSTSTDNPLPRQDATAGVKAWSYVFSLDDIVHGSDGYIYHSGSRQAEASATTGSYKEMLGKGVDRFTAPFWGGADGWDILKPDPVYNEQWRGATPTEDTSYAYHTWKRAMDTIADPEVVDMNVLTAPGLTQNSLTEHMINICESRGDSLALIDLPDVYLPNHEIYKASKKARLGTTPTQAVNDFKSRKIDSSYGATFYPWVQTRDENNGSRLWIPPTVATLGIFGSSERKTQIWFASAGYNRGSLSEGAAGIAITGVSEKLSSKERDNLYKGRINPIASFVDNGIVLFGQKTLQARKSALDRINVRRLVIHMKKQISVISSQILFEQNVQATWDRFKGLVEPFLANVKTNFGITDYKLILDETTTTPDLVDQNVMYAKIMIKPARAIEYIAIDFVITSTGASFDD
jgi:hypothetical protein